MAEFDRRVRAIGERQWGSATPCTDWTVRELLNHLVAEQLWAPWLLRGATLDEVGDRFDGDQLGTDPKGAWGLAARAAREAWEQPGAAEGTVHVSHGTISALEYGWQMTMDLAVHGWDLATALGAESRIHPALAQTLLEIFGPQAGTLREVGIVAPPVAVAVDADAQAKLLAVLGRDPR